MGIYKQKPVEVEARRLNAGNAEAVVAWVKSLGGEAWERDAGSIRVGTLKGVLIAKPGDWIIKGVQGDFYPCKPDIFAATYDRVDTGPPV